MLSVTWALGCHLSWSCATGVEGWIREGMDKREKGRRREGKRREEGGEGICQRKTKK